MTNSLDTQTAPRADVTSTVEVSQPLVTRISTPVPEVQASRPLAIPESGFRHTLTEVGHGVGLITKPLWWPVMAWGRELGKDAHKLTQIPKGLKAQTHGWITKARNDSALWESWTPAQRRSVTKQKASWTGVFFAAAILSFSLPGGWALLPITSFSISWWARSHGFSRLPHFDLVRWGLGLSQLPEDTYR